MYTRRGWIIGAGAAGIASLLPAAQGSDWTQFRGPDRNGISKETGLLRKWPAGGPKIRWSVPVTQGYAAAAIVGGRVYHHDYDEAKSEWCVNCRSLADGKLIWQFREAREIRPNHAITRTVPAVDSRFVCSLDPKAVLHCLDVKTGKQIWRKSLVTEYKATIPSWYNGQNPLQEADRLIDKAAQPDIPALFALAEKLSRITDGLDMLGAFLTQALAERIRARALGGQPHLTRWVGALEKLSNNFARTEGLHLDPRQTLLAAAREMNAASRRAGSV